MVSSSCNCTLNAVKTLLRVGAVMVFLLALVSMAAGLGTACSKEGKALVSLMGGVPEGTGRFTYWAIGDLNEDEDLWVVYDKFKGSADAGQLKDLVQVLSVVKDSARVVGSDNAAASKAPVTVLRAEFDRKDVEDQLDALKYSRSAYRDVNIWVAGDGQSYRPVALLSGTILMGDVSDLKACIDAHKAKDQSLREYPNVKELTDRLPDGLVVEVERGTFFSSEKYDDLVACGRSYTKVKKDTLKLTAVYLFVDEPAASSAEQSVMSDLSAAFEQVKVKRDGNFVIATSQISISKFAEGVLF